MTNPFRFKQFIVHHDRCSMKVGTDCVLLGSWASVSSAETVLDIGSGSGVIALMLAQRSTPTTRIDAVEFDPESAAQASENIARSPWPEKIMVHTTSIQDFFPKQKYDLIVSNPPYFANSLLPPTIQRTHARHTTGLTHQDLLTAVRRLLKLSGKFSVILPTVEGNQFQIAAKEFGLLCCRKMAFYSRLGKQQERWLLEFSQTESEQVVEIIALYQKDLEWTPEYRTLTRDFYLSTQG